MRPTLRPKRCREQQKSNVYLETIAAGINYIRSGNGTLMPA
jgi:hypothetical protein